MAKFSIKNVLMLFIVLISGCSSFTHLRMLAEASDNSERARLRVIAEYPGLIMATPNKNCFDRSDPDSGSVVFGRTFGGRAYHSKRIGMPDASVKGDSISSGELYVLANLPFTLAYVHGFYRGKIYDCNIYVTFVPLAGHDYEVKASLNSSNCFLSISDLTNSRPVYFYDANLCGK